MASRLEVEELLLDKEKIIEMYGLDRLKLELDLDSIYMYNKELFDGLKQVDSDTGIVRYQIKTLKPEVMKQCLGVNEITIKEHTGKVILDVTGKILQKRYPMLIGSGTIEEAIDNLNDYRLAIFDKSKLWDAKILLAHSTIDIETEEPPTNYVKYLTSVTSTLLRTFQVRQHPTGISIGRSANSVIPFLRIYSKYEELTKGNKNNAKLLEYLTEKDMDYFKKILRLEIQIDSAAEFRRYYDFNDIDSPLIQLLYSNQKPVVEVFNQIIEETGIKPYEMA